MARGLETLPHAQMLKPPSPPQQCPWGTKTTARKVSEPPATCLAPAPGPRPFCLAAPAVDRTFLKAEAAHWGWSGKDGSKVPPPRALAAPLLPSPLRPSPVWGSPGSRCWPGFPCPC